jgi:transcriptional repressor NrdR
MSEAIRCPECGWNESRVVESRPDYKRETQRRRRQCYRCNARWTTIEICRDRVDLLEDVAQRRKTHRNR